ncbi:MAG TPA: aroma-sacti cluster domain-containing protein [Gaiellaceae bacterium]|jgi:hypothetical protein
MNSKSTNIDRLYEAGLIGDPATLPEDSVSFMTSLSDDEVTLLISIKERLDGRGIPVLIYEPEYRSMPIF